MALSTTEPLETGNRDPAAHRSAGRLVIGIPTAGRPGIVAQSVRFLAAQTRLPDLVLLSVCDKAHTGGIETADLPFRVEVLLGPNGLSRQRNAILDKLAADDLLMFLDDDFLMAPDYLLEVEQIFKAHPDVVMSTGALIADGILGPGLNFDQGEKILTEAILTPAERRLDPVIGGYGCNMAIRVAPVIAQEISFDENLPLYSWLEDADFSAQLQPFGRFVRSTATRGVHLGTKTGRTPGLNLGYSQIANPVYMLRKGTIAWPRALRLMARNIASNLRGTVRPRPWADYRGRLIGNLTAVVDICLGRCHPERILSFKRRSTYQAGRWRKTAP
ncbi:MAG: glycosyltransferase [bacterium]